MDSAFSSLSFFIMLTVITLISVLILVLKRKVLYSAYFLSFSCLTLLIFSIESNRALLLIGFILYNCLLLMLHLYFKKKIDYLFFIFLALVPLFLFKLKILELMGVSYASFRILQVHFDIHDELLDSVSVFPFILFFTYFPTFFSGPIDRYELFLQKINTTISLDELDEKINKGMKLILLGLIYKFIIGYYAKLLFEYNFNSILLNQLIKIYSYSAFLFFDFAGYSLLAIGFSTCICLDVPVNFNKPFISTSMKEFWTRWHISLSEWFRDYVFIRVVFWHRRMHLMNNTLYLTCLGLVIAFSLMGIWHGFTKCFLLYGLYQGTVLAINELWQNYCRVKQRSALSDPIAWFITINVACIGFRIFSLC
jgi:membrane protein involved in D-alanine export